MKKTVLAIAAAVTIAVGTLSVPTTADARCRGCGVGLGILGGAIIGSAIVANSYPRYADPGPGYVVYDGYYAAGPVDCPGGHWRRRPVALNAYGEPIRWSRARFVCP